MYNINDTIAEKWDKNVLKRAEDLETESDFSYINYIKPYVLECILKYSSSSSKILDVGCGCGYLTNCIHKHNRVNILGIDISKESIKYASNKYKNINFLNGNICDISTSNKYDIALAIMLLNNMPSIDEFFSILYKVLCDKGKVIIVIPHPVFWATKHINHINFYYFNENENYEIPFKTKGRKDYDSSILYFHRSIQEYIRSILNNGFNIIEFRELPESNEVFANPDIIGIVIEKV